MSSQTVTPAGCRTAVALRDRFRTVRAATLEFTEPLSPEDMMVQSSADASPVKWHLAHTSWFFETFVLAPFASGYKAYHTDFHWLFNSYYNSLGEMPAKNLRASFSRPALADVVAYRAYVDEALGGLLETELGGHEGEVLRRVTLGLEHEQQHLELIATDVKHALFTNPLHPAYRSGSASRRAYDLPAPEFHCFAGGLTQIGISPDVNDAQSFAFDNETPRHTVYLQPFALASRLVTVQEYLAFMEDNGYTRPELWLSEGWTTIREQGWQAPLYWMRNVDSASGWAIYTLHGSRCLDELADTPVCHLSFFEADAFARWSALSTPGARLPTEFEWEHAAQSLATLMKGTAARPELISFPAQAAGRTALLATTANMLETAALHPAAAAPLTTLQQMFGDAWEWTSSGYTGYPGYRPLPGALGEYNGKFMSSQVILRGGSCVTPATHIRATYRNFFPPSTRWQFSGVRLARDL